LSVKISPGVKSYKLLFQVRINYGGKINFIQEHINFGSTFD